MKNMGLKGGPTQDEVMAVSLGKLCLKKGDLIVDVGCGTGKISMHAAATAERVLAIDHREEAIAYAQKELTANGCKNVNLHFGEAKDVLKKSGPFNAAFVGGTGDLEEVLGLLAERVSGKIVVNAVLLRTLNTAVETMQRLGIFEEVVFVQIARSSPLVGSVMLKPIDPVYIIVGTGKGEKSC